MRDATGDYLHALDVPNIRSDGYSNIHVQRTASGYDVTWTLQDTGAHVTESHSGAYVEQWVSEGAYITKFPPHVRLPKGV